MEEYFIDFPNELLVNSFEDIPFVDNLLDNGYLEDRDREGILYKNSSGE